MPVKTITAAEQRKAAKIFNFFSCVAIVLMPLIIPTLLWIAASIFVHASIAHHPNQRVRDFLYPGGYRFYGLVGGLVVALNFSPQMSKWVPGVVNFGPLHLPMFWPMVWLLSLVVILPLGIWDIVRANKENWQDMTIEVEEHA
jgi:hypothetical protein